jgi:holo-[acyl-carrier protein] synthase
MVVGLGIDLVELDRVGRSLERWGVRLIEKLMDPDEAARLPSDAEERIHAVALAIAGKEAASKAIGTGWSRGVYWRDVVVDLQPTPAVRLLRQAARVATALGSSGRTRLQIEVRGTLVVAQVRLLA